MLEGTCDASLVPVYIPGVDHPDADSIPTAITIVPPTLAPKMIKSVFCTIPYDVRFFDLTLD